MNKVIRNAKKVVVALTALVVSFVRVLPAGAQGGASADFTVATLSQYIWRGQELSRDSMVIQPSATVSHSGFSANLWGNLDTDPYAPMPGDSGSVWNETDLTLSYGRGFDRWSLEGGYIYYGLEAADDSQEFYVKLGVDVLLAPALTIYRDFDSYEHWYFVLGLSRAFQITEAVSLELSATGSYLLSEDAEVYPEIDSNGTATEDEFSNFHDGVLSASLPISVSESITITPTLSYTFPLSDEAGDEMKWRSLDGDEDSFLYGGVSVRVSF
jgi:hypothetical protein